MVSQKINSGAQKYLKFTQSILHEFQTFHGN